jgi:O-methyltransferase involved in polyketide biosynthesis
MAVPELEAVSETLFLPLYALALEARAARPILIDREAVQLTEELNRTFATSDRRLYRKLARGRFPRTAVTTVALRIRHFDQVVEAFLEREPEGVVVSLGCGLSNRRSRVDNGAMRWVDLDLPAVIQLRQGHFDDTERIRSIAKSVLEFDWMDGLPDDPGERFLFVAEGLFPYLPEDGVKDLVRELHGRFPSAELVAEFASRKVARLMSGRLGKGKLRRRFGLSDNVWFRSGLTDPREPETWAEGIRLLEVWCYFDESEPRIDWMRPFTRLEVVGRPLFVGRYRLG